MTTTPRIRRPLALLATAALAAVALAGCVVLPPRPSAPPATEEHEVSDAVHALRLDTAADVEIALGDDPGLVLRGPKASLDRVTLEEQDGVLVIGSRGAGLTLRGVRVTVTLAALDELVIKGAGDVDAVLSRPGDLAIRVDGAGDVDVEGIDAQQVEVVIAGAGDVELSGSATAGTYRVEGVGDIDAEDLVLADGVVEVTGAGDVAVHATGTLRIASRGLGDITVTGSPRMVE